MVSQVIMDELAFVCERMLRSPKLTEVLSSLVGVKASLDGLANTV